MIESSTQITDRPRILGDLKSLIDSLPAAVRARVIAGIKAVLAELSPRRSEDCRP